MSNPEVENKWSQNGNYHCNSWYLANTKESHVCVFACFDFPYEKSNNDDMNILQ
jgi:hypothetical protein